MPSRMPNWKMRANALVDGRPTTSPCRMPSFGSACMMRTSRRIAAAVMKLSVSSVTGEFVPVAPALAEVPEVAGLEAGVDAAAAVGDRDAAAPFARPARQSPVPPARDVTRGWCRSGRRGGSGRRRRRPVNSRIMASRLRITRSGGSLRTKMVIAVEAVIGSSPRTRRRDRHDGCDRIAGKPHDEKADDGVPEPDHRPRHGQPEQQQQERVGHPEAAGRQRSRGERQQGRDAWPAQARQTGPPAADDFRCRDRH